MNRGRPATSDANGDGRAAISRTMWRWFAWYARRYLRRHFHAVRVSGESVPPPVRDGTPMVVYANHPGWWDPMVAIFLAQHFWPDRRHYFPIDAAMLKKYAFFKRLGFFGVEPEGVRGGIAFLKAADELLKDPRACLWITPQGRFADVRERPLKLRPGLAHLAKRMTADVAIVPVAAEYTFWTERTPEALLRIGPGISTREHAGEGVAQWLEQLEHALEEAMDRLAEDSIRRDAAKFQTLIGGASGTSFAYDTYRRLRAALSGRRFHAEHLPETP